MLPNPWYTDLDRFAAEACLTLEARGAVPQLRNEDWRAWGDALGLLRSPGERQWPSTADYADWRVWATDLISALADVST